MSAVTFLMMALGSDVLSEYPANYLGRGGFIPDDRIVKGRYGPAHAVYERVLISVFAVYVPDR